VAGGAVAGSLAAGRPASTPAGRAVVVYDGPAAAIRDAQLAWVAGRAGGLRLGLQIAEVPRTGPVVDGPGVRGGQGSGLATGRAPGQLLVSATVHDLVGGSGLPLRARGG
jgi:hypothetical protein